MRQQFLFYDSINQRAFIIDNLFHINYKFSLLLLFLYRSLNYTQPLIPFVLIFVATIADKMRATPSQRSASTDSCNINAEDDIATGNSTALRIAPIETPTRGIPIEKKRGGITVPNRANASPQKTNPPK